jgi:hypothetical protein
MPAIPTSATDLRGALLFADPEAPPIARFSKLPGFAASTEPAGVPWSATVSIDGASATLEPRATFVPFPNVLLDHDSRLSQTDRAVVRAARSAVVATVSPGTDDPFLARKRLLRVLGSALGDHGAAALDVSAQRIWTRDALDDELAHDAPLDVDQMYVLHAVTGDAGVYWLHSHGLDTLGGFDFDILRPDPGHANSDLGVVRAAALASIEGRLRPGGDPIRLCSLEQEVHGVAADEFMRRAAPEDARLREPADHTEQRVVLCDPHAKLVPAWLSRPRPSRLFQGKMPERALVFYSTSASRRAGERARGTYVRMRAAMDEFGSMGLPALVKLAYEVDGGGPNDREHMWFEVHACHEEEVEATLMNDPFRIAGMHRGDRARHPVSRLSDWQVMTPMGSIKPTTLHLVRAIRGDRARVEQAIAEHRAARRP